MVNLITVISCCMNQLTITAFIAPRSETKMVPPSSENVNTHSSGSRDDSMLYHWCRKRASRILVANLSKTGVSRKSGYVEDVFIRGDYFCNLELRM